MSTIKPELLRKFFDGNCTPEEVHEVLLWIHSDEGIQQLGDEFDGFEPNTHELENSQDLLSKIHQRIGGVEQNTPLVSREIVRIESAKPKRKPSKWLKWGIAASVLTILLSSLLWLEFVKDDPKPGLQKQTSSLEYVIKKTGAGEKMTLKLNDGSVIRLNSNSAVRFPKSFVEDSREVFIQGQAFFEVQRHESKPFIVHSKELTTSVLGTSFSFSEDSISGLSQVAVLTGKVKVKLTSSNNSGSSNELLLESMDEAKFDGRKDSFEKGKADYDRAFAWKDNVLVFQNARFEEVLRKLENWYGVQFEQKIRIKERKEYSGKFYDQTLEEILIGLSFTYGFEFTIKESIIIIH